jgi:prophage antirepressor-like protein
MKDDQPWFVASDVCGILEIGNTSDAVRRLEEDEKGLGTIDTLGGLQSVICVNESGVYELVWGSRKTEAKKFKKWIKTEVLPSIRKTGSYNVEFKLPQSMPEALRLLAAQIEETETVKAENIMLVTKTQDQEEVIQTLQPKASYCDTVLQAKNLMSVTVIAKDYGMSGQSLNNLLHELGVQYKSGDTWVLYQKHADKGYAQTKTHIVTIERSRNGLYWNQKGRMFIYELLKKEKGILPIMERAS